MSGKPLARNRIGQMHGSAPSAAGSAPIDRPARPPLPRHHSRTALEVSYVTVTFSGRVAVSPKTSAAQRFMLCTPAGSMLSKPYCDAGATISSEAGALSDTRVARRRIPAFVTVTFHSPVR